MFSKSTARRNSAAIPQITAASDGIFRRTCASGQHTISGRGCGNFGKTAASEGPVSSLSASAQKNSVNRFFGGEDFSQVPVRNLPESSGKVRAFGPDGSSDESSSGGNRMPAAVGGEPSDGAGTAAPAAAAGKCGVKSFAMGFPGWKVSWPNLLWGKTTISLPVNFSLVLDSASKKEDCLIGQEKKGQVEHRGIVVDNFSSWTKDAPARVSEWWDGQDWHPRIGRWNWWNWWDSASFSDAPGFYDAELHQYPLYWGGSGHQGHFEFRTYVADRATGSRVRELTWGMLIDYSQPNVGSRNLYK